MDDQRKLDDQRKVDGARRLERLRRENIGQTVRENKAAVRETVILTLPNVVSALRMALAPVLVWLATEQQADYFLVVLALSLFTDIIDGHLARKLNQVSEFGTRLDSWADLTTYAVMLLGLWLIWPATFLREQSYLVMAFSCWLVPTLVCLARFKKLPSFHTWAAKITAVAVAPAYFIMALWDYSEPFRVVMFFYLWVAVEQVVIISILPRWQGDVSGLLRALALARHEHQAASQDKRD